MPFRKPLSVQKSSAKNNFYQKQSLRKLMLAKAFNFLINNKGVPVTVIKLLSIKLVALMLIYVNVVDNV